MLYYYFPLGGEIHSYEVLQERAVHHVLHVLAESSRGKLRTATNWLRIFMRKFPKRRPFLKTPRYRGDLKVELYNEWSMILFVTWMATVTSRRTGIKLNVDTISQYQSMLKSALSTQYGFDVLGDPKRLPRVLKKLQREQPYTERKKRRGLRRRHLRKAWKAASKMLQPDLAMSDTARRDRANKWAAITTAWQALARGCEVSAKSRRKWNASTLPTRADLSFHIHKNGTRYAVLLLRARKKRGRSPKIPLIFSEDDHGGADTYWALHELERLDPVDESLRHKTPLFRTTEGALTQREFIKTIKDIAQLIGLDSSLFNGHSCRIGGATDLIDAKGSPLLLQAKGRWGSDIGRIYARMTRRAQISASKLIQKGKGGRDLEDIFPDFTQPAL